MSETEYQSSTPETSRAWKAVVDWSNGRDETFDPMHVHLAELAEKLERERDQLAGYLCRIKLPLPMKFLADLAELFPGENVRMKEDVGYLCVFQENGQDDTSA